MTFHQDLKGSLTFSIALYLATKVWIKFSESLVKDISVVLGLMRKLCRLFAH